jgi:diguanylate cyclase (GGDEF)-like protein
MEVRFWGTRGSIPTPGYRTAIYGGNTSCVEVRTPDGTVIVLDCGTGVRELGLNLSRPGSGAQRIHLLIGHTHWDHIQGFPFFLPAFLPGMELNIYAPSGFQRSLEDSLSGQMQYSYFPVKLHDLSSRIHFTELEEGFFRIGDALVETQYLNHTAPTIAYRISSSGATVVYVADHEPFWPSSELSFQHPGDQRHIAFLRGADLVIHDSQYTCGEYESKQGWGHSPIEYATDVAIAARVGRLALFHHDPTHDDPTLRQLESVAQARVAASGAELDVFAAAEGMHLEITGQQEFARVAESSALERRPISGRRVLVVTDRESDVTAIDQVLMEDNLVLIQASNGKAALERAPGLNPDLIILNALLNDGAGVDFIGPLRARLNRAELPVLLLTDGRSSAAEFHSMGHLATDYLVKPFSPPMLRTRVRAWLARQVPAAANPDIRPAERGQRALEGKEGLGLSRSYDELLASVPLFRALNPDTLGNLLSDKVEHVFPAGHTLIRQGEPGRAVYVILSGRVRIAEALPDTPVDMLLGELGPGEVVGEIGILWERPCSATIVTLERTTCLILEREQFLETLKNSPEMSLSLLRTLAGRLYEADRLLARHAPDPLTGLPGRRAFHELYRPLAAVARRRKSTVMLLAVDIIGLKRINDRLGYDVGDNTLRSVADALLEACRTTDLVSRYGSDEFAALLVEASEKDADVILNRVQQKLGEIASRRGLPVPIECSFGMAVSHDPPDSPDELLRAADRDMQAKRREAFH